MHDELSLVELIAVVRLFCEGNLSEVKRRFAKIFWGYKVTKDFVGASAFWLATSSMLPSDLPLRGRPDRGKSSIEPVASKWSLMLLMVDFVTAWPRNVFAKRRFTSEGFPSQIENKRKTAMHSFKESSSGIIRQPFGAVQIGENNRKWGVCGI